MITSAKPGPFAVPLLDLSRLRDLAFGAARPDHPLYNEAEVHKMIAKLPEDPVAGLAELTQWAVSVNRTDSFTPQHRARVLTAMDVAAHDRWRQVCSKYFAPNGTPSEGRDIDAGAIHSLLSIATEFASGFALSLGNEALESGWIKKNLAQMMLRRALWLARRLTLANMLHQPDAASMWEEAHSLYRQAHIRQVLWTPQQAFPDAPTTSVAQEYVRLLMMDIAGQDTLSGREIELAFRIAGRVAASARLEPQPIPEALYAVVPERRSRPILVRRLGKSSPALYLDTSLCLPQLQALLQRDSNSDLAQPDAAFHREFTVREARDMVERLLEYWGPNPPKRRAQRVALDAPALLRCGLESAVEAVAPLEQGAPLRNAAASALHARLEEEKRDPHARTARTARETRARLADASAAGLGLRVPRKDAEWARMGALLATCVESGPDWIVGTLRRISAEGDMLRFGIRILARRPRLAWFHAEAAVRAPVSDHENRPEENFLEFYRRGILLDVDLSSGAAGEMLVPHGVVKVGYRLDFPLAGSVQHVRVTAERETTKGFDRVAFEALGATPCKVKVKEEAEADTSDPWRLAV